MGKKYSKSIFAIHDLLFIVNECLVECVYLKSSNSYLKSGNSYLKLGKSYSKSRNPFFAIHDLLCIVIECLVKCGYLKLRKGNL